MIGWKTLQWWIVLPKYLSIILFLDFKTVGQTVHLLKLAKCPGSASKTSSMNTFYVFIKFSTSKQIFKYMYNEFIIDF